MDLDIQRARLVELNERLATLPLPAIVAGAREQEFVQILDLIAEYSLLQANFLRDTLTDEDRDEDA